MVTVILLALSTSVGSVISVIPISDDMFAGYPTTTNDATFISAILASATTCYRKEKSKWAGEEGGGERAGEEGEGRGQERKGMGRGRRGRGRGGGRRGRARGGAGEEGEEGGGEVAGEEGGGEVAGEERKGREGGIRCHIVTSDDSTQTRK